MPLAPRRSVRARRQDGVAHGRAGPDACIDAVGLELIEQGAVDPSYIITHRVGLSMRRRCTGPPYVDRLSATTTQQRVNRAWRLPWRTCDTAMSIMTV
jgi:hypothetical protein